jgi:hypothetical protein
MTASRWRPSIAPSTPASRSSTRPTCTALTPTKSSSVGPSQTGAIASSSPPSAASFAMPAFRASGGWTAAPRHQEGVRRELAQAQGGRHRSLSASPHRSAHPGRGQRRGPRGARSRRLHEGKVRYVGLSEASADTLRRAHRVHPIASVESEYSLWTPDPEDGVLAACAELGIGFLACSPLGRGFLKAAALTLSADDLARIEAASRGRPSRDSGAPRP